MSPSPDAAARNVILEATQKLFPFHIAVDHNFVISSVGKELPPVLGLIEADVVGHKIEDILTMCMPKESCWDWAWIQNQGERSFTVEPCSKALLMVDLRFKVDTVHISEKTLEAMFNLVPDVHDTVDLFEMGLTPEDLPKHGAYRELLDLKDKMSSQEKNGASVLQIQRTLEKERALLESLVPKHVAEGLRKGENVQPRQHPDCTFFFSDVVGFTNMYKQLYPWQVTGMLNRLYCVMDHLAEKFNLCKIETIGDAYVCASGLPDDDPNHASNVANFAVAVNHCARHILSPVDGSPIQMRIGIHSGSAASGVVGVKSPRYCVFGDAVNLTARHESTGEPGRVHCSSVTQKELEKSGAIVKFCATKRGLVEMKGKGKLRTYWLEASDANEFSNKDALLRLDTEIVNLLSQSKFDSRMEQETTKKTVELNGRLEQGSFHGENKDFMGPILKMIQRDLSNRSLTSSIGSISSHTIRGPANGMHKMNMMVTAQGMEGARRSRRKLLEKSKSAKMGTGNYTRTATSLRSLDVSAHSTKSCAPRLGDFDF